MNKEEYFRKRIEGEDSTKQKLFYSAVFLFSERGFSNVGIRELCRSVNVKESAFYNHYSSKTELFDKILGYFREKNDQVVYSEGEIEAAVSEGDIRSFFLQNMQKFSRHTGDPLYHTILQIVKMESFVNPEARRIAGRNLYQIRGEYTEKVLSGLMEKGQIKKCDPKVVAVEYYYALGGLLDEYLLLEIWNEDLGPVNQKIADHIAFFSELLRK